MSEAQPWKFQVNYEGMWNESELLWRWDAEKGGVVTHIVRWLEDEFIMPSLVSTNMMEMFEKHLLAVDMLANLAARGVLELHR